MMVHQFFSRHDHDDVVVLTIMESELSDLVLQDQLDVALVEFVESQQPPKLLLDLSNVEYCATGVINTFLSVRKRLAQQGGALKLCALSDSLRLAFRSLNLENTVFSIDETVEEAIEAFNAPA